MPKIEKPQSDLTPILKKEDLVGRTITSVAEIGSWPETLMLKLGDDRYFSVTATVDVDGDASLSFRPYDLSCNLNQAIIDAVDASILNNSGFLPEDWEGRRRESLRLLDEQLETKIRQSKLKDLHQLQAYFKLPVTPEEEVPL